MKTSSKQIQQSQVSLSELSINQSVQFQKISWFEYIQMSSLQEKNNFSINKQESVDRLKNHLCERIKNMIWDSSVERETRSLSIDTQEKLDSS